MNPFYYVVIAGVCAGAYQIFRKITSPLISSYITATVFSAVAVIMGSVLIFLNRHQIDFKPTNGNKGWLIILIGGLLVFPIDYLIIKAYNSNYPITLGAVIVTGISMGTAVLFGLFMGENLSFLKIFAITLIVTGVVILKYQV